MMRNLKPALISAVVVVILSGLLMGIRLSQQGTSLVLVGGGMDVAVKIAAAALFISRGTTSGCTRLRPS